MTSTPPASRPATAPSAEPTTPMRGRPRCPLMAAQATTMFRPLTTNMTNRGVRVSPAPRRLALPMNIRVEKKKTVEARRK